MSNTTLFSHVDIGRWHLNCSFTRWSLKSERPDRLTQIQRFKTTHLLAISLECPDDTNKNTIVLSDLSRAFGMPRDITHDVNISSSTWFTDISWWWSSEEYYVTFVSPSEVIHTREREGKKPSHTDDVKSSINGKFAARRLPKFLWVCWSKSEFLTCFTDWVHTKDFGNIRHGVGHTLQPRTPCEHLLGERSHLSTVKKATTPTSYTNQARTLLPAFLPWYWHHEPRHKAWRQGGQYDVKSELSCSGAPETEGSVKMSQRHLRGTLASHCMICNETNAADCTRTLVGQRSTPIHFKKEHTSRSTTIIVTHPEIRPNHFGCMKTSAWRIWMKRFWRQLDNVTGHLRVSSGLTHGLRFFPTSG